MFCVYNSYLKLGSLLTPYLVELLNVITLLAVWRLWHYMIFTIHELYMIWCINCQYRDLQYALHYWQYTHYTATLLTTLRASLLEQMSNAIGLIGRLRCFEVHGSLNSRLYIMLFLIFVCLRKP